MSQGRLFELLCLLLERGRMTAPQLAERVIRLLEEERVLD